MLYNFTAETCQTGGLLDPSSTNVVASVDIVGGDCDHDGTAFYINPGASAAVVRTRCTQCWFADGGTQGLVSGTTGTINGVEFWNSTFAENNANGATVQSGNNWAFYNSVFTNNQGSGLAVNATSGLVVQGNKFGNSFDGWSGGYSQAYGIFQNATGQTYANISNNVFQSNATSPSNFAYIANSIIANNTGWNPIGVKTAGTCTSSTGTCTLPTTQSNSPSFLYIVGGTVSGVTVGGSTVCATTPCPVELGPGQQAVITGSSTPPTATWNIQ